MTPSPSPLVHQVRHGLDRYEAWHQVLVVGKEQLATSIAEIASKNRRRWGRYADADPQTGVSDRYLDDLIYHYLTQHQSILALKQREGEMWQMVMDRLAKRIEQRLYAHTHVARGRIPDLVDDLTQHCAKLLWMRLDAFTFDCSFWAWLEVMVAREMRGFLRRADFRHHARALRLDDDLENLSSLAGDQSAFRTIDDFVLLEGLLLHLPADQRRAIALTLHGYECEEIAELMGRSVSAVHNLRSRAYRSLRHRVSDQKDLRD